MASAIGHPRSLDVDPDPGVTRTNGATFGGNVRASVEAICQPSAARVR
jgi:hypothetical protein